VAEPWLLIGADRHPFCGWPADQPATFTEQWRRGAGMAVLMGHGSEGGFESIATDTQSVSYVRRMPSRCRRGRAARAARRLYLFLRQLHPRSAVFANRFS